MAKTKIISLFLLFVGILSASANNEFSWRRVVMDGSRRTDSLRVAASPTAKKMISFIESFRPQMADLNEVVGYSPEELTKRRPESPLGNWFADLLIEEAQYITGEKCDVSIMNVGGIRVNMPQGNVTVEDIRSMFPFKNYVTVVKLTGERLLQILNEMAPRAWEALGGVRVVADSTHVINARIDGKDIDKASVYTLVTNDFLLHGGDHLFLGEDVISCDVTEYLVYDVVMMHLERLRKEGRHITGSRDNRVTLVSVTHSVARKKELRKAASASVPAPAPQKKDFRLTILHTNDTHSHVDPIRSGEQKNFGGYVERAIFIDSVRVADGARNVLLLDAGDFEQGSPYFTLFGGKTEIGAMNIMGYDATTMGNHEWDNGTDALAKRLRKARFKNVLCNYKIENKALARTLKPYAIFRRGGLKVGVVGILTNVTSLCDKDKCGGISYLDPGECATAQATFLKEKKHCDLVIVLSHYGFGGNPSEPGDLEMVPNTKNIDIVIGGHTHTNLKAPVYRNDADGKPVMIVTDFCWGTYVGEIKY